MSMPMKTPTAANGRAKTVCATLTRRSAMRFASVFMPPLVGAPAMDGRADAVAPADAPLVSRPIVGSTHARIQSLAIEEALERIEEDTHRNFWLEASAAQRYGLVGRIIERSTELDTPAPSA